jgi:L-ascorbate metabolism protein UlaG (beta-lactamase superfamily)
MASISSFNPRISLEYFGRSCFEIRYESKRIVIDPFNPEIFQYSSQGCRYTLPEKKIDYAIASHNAPDHNYFEGIDANRKYTACGDKPGFIEVIKGNTAEISGEVTHDFGGRSFSFWTVPSFHDDQQGAVEGVNGIICLNFDGLRVVHLGDIGHTLTPEQVEDIGVVHVLMVPVDDYYTVDTETAVGIVKQLKPKMVIPIHYKTDNLARDLPFSDEKKFVSRFNNVSIHNRNYISIGIEDMKEELTVIVLKYLREE